MTTASISYKRRLKHAIHAIKDNLGLPVNFTDDEARRAKQRFTEATIASSRVRQVAAVFGVPEQTVEEYVRDAQSLAVQQERDRVERDLPHVGSPMSTDDSITLYAAVRAMRPKLAVETGTAAGASATYLLDAMRRYGGGQLHSCELSDDAGSVGMLVPDHLKGSMTIHTGDSLQLLPPLLQEIGPIDLFLHDSNHSYRHMMAEYELAREHLRSGGILASHDILHCNAWKHFLRRNNVRRVVEVRNFGVCVVE